jgi:hypothetical protein
LGAAHGWISWYVSSSLDEFVRKKSFSKELFFPWCNFLIKSYSSVLSSNVYLASTSNYKKYPSIITDRVTDYK